jgi:hypothetical protein
MPDSGVEAVGATGVVDVTVEVAFTDDEYVVGSAVLRFVNTAEAKSIDFKLEARESAFAGLSITILD